jgi:hypothetical protein
MCLLQKIFLELSSRWVVHAAPRVDEKYIVFYFKDPFKERLLGGYRR